MKTRQSNQEDSFKFLQQYKSGSEKFSLSSGKQVPIQKYFLTFNPWKGASIPNTYNNKPVIDWNGEPVFAELAVLQLFQSYGWSGVWVDTYRKKFRIGLPDVADPIDLPAKQKKIFDSIQGKTGKSGGCWDVFVWKGDQLIFAELKRLKKDKIQSSQNEWLKASLARGLKPENFALIEWSLRK